MRRYDTPPPDLVRFENLPEFTNITYRQIDYWLRNNIITVVDPLPGSGNRRWYNQNHVDRLLVIDRLIPQLSLGDHHRQTATGIIGAIWDVLAEHPWPPVIVLQRHDHLGWVTGDIDTSRLFIVVPITEAPEGS